MSDVSSTAISDDVLEAATKALAAAACVQHYGGEDMARAVVAAAVPLIEQQLRQQIYDDIWTFARSCGGSPEGNTDLFRGIKSGMYEAADIALGGSR